MSRHLSGAERANEKMGLSVMPSRRVSGGVRPLLEWVRGTHSGRRV